MSQRAPVPTDTVQRIAAVLDRLPECTERDAWTGIAWQVRHATVAHLYGGEDGKVRVTFRAEPGEVEAFAHLGGPYFKADWGTDVVGLVLDEHTDWDELAELLTDSYCVQAPRGLAAQVDRPGPPPGTPPDGSLAS